jgi:hypothetical protein
VTDKTLKQVDDRTLEQRLKATEDRLAILDLEGAYGQAYDSKQGALWASLFTEDGIYQGRQLAGMPAQNFVQGRENLARFCEEEPLSGMHFTHAPHITLNGNEATGRVHFQFQASGVDAYGRTQSRAVSGYYDIAYVRTTGGWRIRRRVTTYLEAAHKTVYPYEPSPVDLDYIVQPSTASAPYADQRS